MSWAHTRKTPCRPVSPFSFLFSPFFLLLFSLFSLLFSLFSLLESPSYFPCTHSAQGIRLCSKTSWHAKKCHDACQDTLLLHSKPGKIKQQIFYLITKNTFWMHPGSVLQCCSMCASACVYLLAFDPSEVRVQIIYRYSIYFILLVIDLNIDVTMKQPSYFDNYSLL